MGSVRQRSGSVKMFEFGFSARVSPLPTRSSSVLTSWLSVVQASGSAIASILIYRSAPLISACIACILTGQENTVSVLPSLSQPQHVRLKNACARHAPPDAGGATSAISRDVRARQGRDGRRRFDARRRHGRAPALDQEPDERKFDHGRPRADGLADPARPVHELRLARRRARPRLGRGRLPAEAALQPDLA